VDPDPRKKKPFSEKVFEFSKFNIKVNDIIWQNISTRNLYYLQIFTNKVPFPFALDPDPVIETGSTKSIKSGSNPDP
jgi:hypothetical protein